MRKVTFHSAARINSPIRIIFRHQSSSDGAVRNVSQVKDSQEFNSNIWSAIENKIKSTPRYNNFEKKKKKWITSSPSRSFSSFKVRTSADRWYGLRPLHHPEWRSTTAQDSAGRTTATTRTRQQLLARPNRMWCPVRRSASIRPGASTSSQILNSTATCKEMASWKHRPRTERAVTSRAAAVSMEASQLPTPLPQCTIHKRRKITPRSCTGLASSTSIIKNDDELNLIEKLNLKLKPNTWIANICTRQWAKASCEMSKHWSIFPRKIFPSTYKNIRISGQSEQTLTFKHDVNQRV